MLSVDTNRVFSSISFSIEKANLFKICCLLLRVSLKRSLQQFKPNYCQRRRIPNKPFSEASVWRRKKLWKRDRMSDEYSLTFFSFYWEEMISLKSSFHRENKKLSSGQLVRMSNDTSSKIAKNHYIKIIIKKLPMVYYIWNKAYLAWPNLTPNHPSIHSLIA